MSLSLSLSISLYAHTLCSLRAAIFSELFMGEATTLTKQAQGRPMSQPNLAWRGRPVLLLGQFPDTCASINRNRLVLQTVFFITTALRPDRHYGPNAPLPADLDLTFAIKPRTSAAAAALRLRAVL